MTAHHGYGSGVVSSNGERYADRDAFLIVLDRALAAIEPMETPYVFVGGLASTILGRPRWTRDLDILVRPDDAERTLQALASAGFETELAQPHWLAKARIGEVVVDVLSRSQPDIMLDDEMLERAVEAEYEGRRLRLACPEDLLVMKAVAANEDTPRYWYDAIALAARNDLDWDYLVARARRAGIRRVLAALLYAQSNDVGVPMAPIESLADLVLDRVTPPSSGNSP